MRILSFILFFYYITLSSVWADNLNASDWINHADAKADIINNAGNKIGIVYAKQGTKGVLLRLDLNKLPSGIHGMHFHNVGDCSDHQHFQSAGGHIDTQQKPHGFLNLNGPHEGNLPNLIVDNNGHAMLELYSDMVSINNDKNGLLDSDGSTLIIHENPDDHISQPIGNAGTRIACGVFKKIND